MTLATSLRNAARNLIDTFGNDATVYTYSTATKAENEEGDVTVSSWGDGTAIIVVDGDNSKEEIIQAIQGMESIGDDEKIMRDDVTIVTNDRLNIDGVDYRVMGIKPVRTQSTLVILIVKISRVDLALGINFTMLDNSCTKE